MFIPTRRSALLSAALVFVLPSALLSSAAAQEPPDPADPADLEPPEAPWGLIGVDVDGMVLLGWAPSAEDDLAGYVVRRSNQPGGPYADVATVRADLNGHEDPAPPPVDGHYVVLAVDAVGNRSSPSNEVTVAVAVAADDDPPADPDLRAELEHRGDPKQETEGDPEDAPEEEPESDPEEETEGDSEEDPEDALEGQLLEEPKRETFVYGTVTGAVDAIAEADGVRQRVTETLSGGAETARHDRLDHRWSIPAAEGNQRLEIVAEADDDAGDADEGFVIGWSIDRIEWTPLATIRPGEAIDESFDIGAPEDTVHVRVLDTDRTPRQQRPDSVFVDLLRVVGDGLPVEPEPEPTEAVAEVGFHYQGLGQGDRAIVVTASVTDDRGDPVAGATIDVAVAGDIEETVTITTGSDGTGVQQTTGAALRPEVEVCVADVQADGLAHRSLPDDCPVASAEARSSGERANPGEPPG